jgi:hypothetical protein
MAKTYLHYSAWARRVLQRPAVQKAIALEGMQARYEF